MPKISIITICYNAEHEIEKTMESVLEQTFLDLEYIVVDGASTDATVEIAEKVKLRYSNRNVRIYSEPDNGIYDAMNKGIKYAEGEWLNMMNAGDSYVNDKVLTNIFSEKIPKGKTVIYSDSFLIKKDGRRIIIHHDMSKYPYGFCHQAIIYKKKLHDEHGMYVFSKKLIISDTLFFIRIPVEEMMKVDTIIANFAAGGASGNAGYDLQKQNLCAQRSEEHTSELQSRI